MVPPKSLKVRREEGLSEVAVDFIKTWVSINLQRKSRWERAGWRRGLIGDRIRIRGGEGLIGMREERNTEVWKETGIKPKEKAERDEWRPHFTELRSQISIVCKCNYSCVFTVIQPSTQIFLYFPSLSFLCVRNFIIHLNKLIATALFLCAYNLIGIKTSPNLPSRAAQLSSPLKLKWFLLD